MIHFRFNQEKAIAAILFVAHKLNEHHSSQSSDLHKIFKILYFADRKHLVEFGRPITGDVYIAMDHGGVPSKIYDIMKMVRGDSLCQHATEFNEIFDVYSHFLCPKQHPVMEELSQSDLECLKNSILENQDLTFKQLKEKSHDDAYKKAGKDDKISFREMAKVLGADETIMEFIKLNSENESILSK